MARTINRKRRPGPQPVDIHVGKRVRLRRNMLGLSQEKLGEHLGLTFQQVQKYERGANRIGASRLWELTKILGVPIDFFYMDDDPVRAPALADEPEAVEQFESGGADLIAQFYRIGDEAIRRQLLGLARSMVA